MSQPCTTWTEDAVQLYQQLLNKQLPAFPAGFWQNKNALKCAGALVRYLFENVLNFNHEEIATNASRKFFYQHKLGVMLKILFKNSALKAVNNAYPNKFQPWEIHVVNGYWDDLNNGIKATKWLIEERLKWDDEQIKSSLKQYIFKENKLEPMLRICFNNSTFRAINETYPGRFKEWELKSTPKNFWTIEKGIEATKWLFDEKLKWDLKDNRKRIQVNIKVFQENGLYGMLQTVFQSSSYEAMKHSYPEYNWEMLKLSRGRTKAFEQSSDV